jgi:hypothetical protein
MTNSQFIDNILNNKELNDKYMNEFAEVFEIDVNDIDGQQFVDYLVEEFEMLNEG